MKDSEPLCQRPGQSSLAALPLHLLSFTENGARWLVLTPMLRPWFRSQFPPCLCAPNLEASLLGQAVLLQGRASTAGSWAKDSASHWAAVLVAHQSPRQESES